METILVYGLLDAGKTTYIQDAILHDYFYKYGSTLILCFESGETEYDTSALADRNTHIAYYENSYPDWSKDPSDITAFCHENLRRYDPDRVYVEMNAMIPGLRKLLPEELEVRFVVTLIDFNTLSVYINNLRQFINDMIKESDTVTFRDCASKEALSAYSQLFRMMNPKATYLRRDPMGYHERAFDLFLPYDLNGSGITIGENDYIFFCLDTLEHPEHYDGKLLSFDLPLEIRENKCGRTVMTCCMADIQFMGCTILTPDPTSPENAPVEPFSISGRIPAGGWITLSAQGKLTTGSYGEKSLSLIPLHFISCPPPKTLILNAI